MRKLPIEASLNEAGTTSNKSEKSSCAYFSYGTVLPKPNFRVIKHAK